MRGSNRGERTRISGAGYAWFVVLTGLVAGAGACTSEVARVGSSHPVASQIDALGRVVTARCAPAAPGRTACSGVELGRPAAGAFSPDDLVDELSGWGALDFASAYDIPTANPVTAKIAILTAGYNPSLESDLAVYRAQYQLPDCTVASGCLTVVDAHGGSIAIGAGPGTGFAAPRYEDIAESSLEVQVASAGCPSCQLLVVVAGSDPAFTPTLTELASAAGEAVALGATVMVTGYGAPELDENGSPWSASYEKAFSAWPAVPLFAASGDDGFLDGSSPDQSVRVPAAFPEVFAVGGTTLTQVTADVSPRRWTEAALPTASSGCSVVFAKPAGQLDTACPKRTLNDVSASADPALVYFTTVDPASGDQPGWHTEGGTGESAALVGSFFAAAGIAYGRGASFVYEAPRYFDDVTSGSNGSCAASPASCNAQAGYDAPTGVGSPYGGAQVTSTSRSRRPARPWGGDRPPACSWPPSATGRRRAPRGTSASPDCRRARRASSSTRPSTRAIRRRRWGSPRRSRLRSRRPIA